MRFYPGLKPWDLDRLWPAEITALIDHANETARLAELEARKAARKR